MKIKKLLIFILLCISTFLITVSAEQLVQKDYKLVFRENITFNLDTGIQENSELYMSTERIPIIKNLYVRNKNIQVPELPVKAHHIMFWNDKNQYIGYMNYSSSTYEAAKFLGNVTGFIIDIPDKAQKFSIIAIKTNGNSIVSHDLTLDTPIKEIGNRSLYDLIDSTTVTTTPKQYNNKYWYDLSTIYEIDKTLNINGNTLTVNSNYVETSKQIISKSNNLLSYNGSLPYTNSGVTISYNNGVYSVVGTSTGYPFKAIFTIPANSLKQGTYTVRKNKISGTTDIQGLIRIIDRVDTPAVIWNNTLIIGATHNELLVEIACGLLTYDETFTLQLNEGSTALPYQPYATGSMYVTDTQVQTLNILTQKDTTISLSSQELDYYYSLYNRVKNKINITYDTLFQAPSIPLPTNEYLNQTFNFVASEYIDTDPYAITSANITPNINSIPEFSTLPYFIKFNYSLSNVTLNSINETTKDYINNNKFYKKVGSMEFNSTISNEIIHHYIDYPESSIGRFVIELNEFKDFQYNNVGVTMNDTTTARASNLLPQITDSTIAEGFTIDPLAPIIIFNLRYQDLDIPLSSTLEEKETAFKNYLIANPVTIYYTLNIPEQYTLQTKVEMYSNEIYDYVVVDTLDYNTQGTLYYFLSADITLNDLRISYAFGVDTTISNIVSIPINEANFKYSPDGLTLYENDKANIINSWIVLGFKYLKEVNLLHSTYDYVNTNFNKWQTEYNKLSKYQAIIFTDFETTEAFYTEIYIEPVDTEFKDTVDGWFSSTFSRVVAMAFIIVLLAIVLTILKAPMFVILVSSVLVAILFIAFGWLPMWFGIILMILLLGLVILNFTRKE